MSGKFRMTGHRAEALRQVRERLVRYDPSRAEWTVDQKAVRGWRGRTLAELRRSRHVQVVAHPAGLSTVELTEAGREALLSLESDLDKP